MLSPQDRSTLQNIDSNTAGTESELGTAVSVLQDILKELRQQTKLLEALAARR